MISHYREELDKAKEIPQLIEEIIEMLSQIEKKYPLIRIRDWIEKDILPKQRISKECKKDLKNALSKHQPSLKEKELRKMLEDQDGDQFFEYPNGIAIINLSAARRWQEAKKNPEIKKIRKEDQPWDQFFGGAWERQNISAHERERQAYELERKIKERIIKFTNDISTLEQTYKFFDEDSENEDVKKKIQQKIDARKENIATLQSYVS